MTSAAAAKRIGRILRGFLRANTAVSTRIGALWPHTRFSAFDDYAAIVAAELQREDVRLAVDVGAGLSGPYKGLRADDGARLVGVDLSREAMRGNADLDERRIAMVGQEPLPFADGEVDLVVSSSLVEHLRDVEALVEEAARVLRPGGAFVNVFPSRFALFAILNRALPQA